MTTTASEQATERTFTSLNPANGEVVGEHPIHGADQVGAAIERARAAADWWAGLGWRHRKARLLTMRAVLVRYLRRLAELVHVETGKPIRDAELEVLLAVAHLDWAAKHAHKVLGPHRVGPGLLGANLSAKLEYRPVGVVGVIGPWNYPVFTPMGSIGYALAAGNAVVFKPSEYTPGVGTLLVELLSGVVPEQPLVQVVTGYGETGAALARGGVGKLAFTGSTATAKKVMAACAETLTPMVAECGGKDALIVDEGADLDDAAQAAVWGAASNAGQTCIGVERVYAVESVYDAFVAKLTEQAKGLRAGDDPEADYGPITMPGQLDIISGHIDDALARGGTALVGGPDSVRAPYVDPVVIAGVPEDSEAVTKETFGPTITVAKVTSADEAVARANATSYGLGSAVFSGSGPRAMALARRLRSGMTSINTVVSFAGVPALPFGGVGDSGFGRIHGADGLREFTSAKAITRKRFPIPLNPQSFGEKGDKSMATLVKAANIIYGRRH